MEPDNPKKRPYLGDCEAALRNPARSYSIRTLLCLLVLACVVPSASVIIGVVAYDYHRERTQLLDNAVGTARSITMLVDQVFSGIETVLTTLGTASSLDEGDRARFYGQAQQVLRGQIGRNIVLTDSGGTQLVNTLMPFGATLSSRSNPALVHQLAVTHAPAVSDLFRSATDDKQIISVAVPLLRDGLQTYNLNMRLPPSVFSNLLAQQGLSADWVVAITDSTGTIIARTRDNDRFVGTKASRDLLNALLTHSEGIVVGKTLEGIAVVASFSQSDKTGWTTVIGIPLPVLTRELHHRILVVAMATFVILLLGLSCAWVIGGRILRANRGLVAPALALGEGTFVHVPRFGLQEADDIGAALNKAAARLSNAQYKANHDYLTGLPNRGLFHEVASRQLQNATRSRAALALLFIDLDGFKLVNDQHGHATGDALLCQVAFRLGQMLRASDTLSRLGGDEFAVALPDSSADQAVIVGRKLVEGLSQPYAFGSLKVCISASIGVAVSGPDMPLEILLRAADDAMYVAKSSGKARVYCNVT